MTSWNFLPQRHRVPPYWIASMHASISKKRYNEMLKGRHSAGLHTYRGCPIVLELEMPKQR